VPALNQKVMLPRCVTALRISPECAGQQRSVVMRSARYPHSIQALEVTQVQRRVQTMYFGGAIAMIAVGAILSFAVRDAVPGVDLTVVGYILMVAGALGIVLTIAMNGRRDARAPRRDDPPPPAV